MKKLLLCAVLVTTTQQYAAFRDWLPTPAQAASYQSGVLLGTGAIVAAGLAAKSTDSASKEKLMATAVGCTATAFILNSKMPTNTMNCKFLNAIGMIIGVKVGTDILNHISY